jgi:capsular exopolysaccharide synthesis family protein
LDLWLVIRKRRVLLVCFALGAAALGFGFGVMRGKEYTATGEIEIQPGSASSLKSISSLFDSELSSLDEIMETDVAILQSPSLLVDVARNLNLLKNKDFVAPGAMVAGPNGTKLPLWDGDLNSPYVRNAVAGELKAGLTAARVPRTELISISFKSRSPSLSADIVDGIESTFIEENFKSKFNTTQQVSKWLTSQIEDLRSQVQSSQDRMVDLQKKLGIYAFDPQHTLAIGEVSNLDKGISDATEARVLAEARYRILSSLPPDQIQDAPTAPGDSSQSLLSGLRSQRATAAAALARLQPVYGPNYPQVKQLNAEIASLDQQISKQEGRVVQQAKDAYGVAESAENQAKSLLGQKEQQFYGQRDDIVHYMLLNEEYESNRQMYESILTRLREAAVDSGLDSADISLVDLASLPISPSSMPPSKLAELGLLFGLFTGLTLGLFMEKMDTRLRDAHEIQEMLQLPPLAVIPQGHWKLREADVASPVGPELLRDPRSPFSESFRALRTSMQLSSTSRQSKLITITSCQPAEGKSTVAVNTAAVLAQGGKRVALVDTDMRRPSVYKRLGIEGGKGLSEVLTGHFTLDQVTHTHSTLATLDVIPSGTVPPLPADLLASEAMAELVQQLRGRYDYVIFDTPPILSVTDPTIVAAQSDGIVLVIRQGFCTRGMLARTAASLRELDVKVYGFVLNGVDASLPEYYGYLGYYTYEYGK